jgi:hypothetical protein
VRRFLLFTAVAVGVIAAWLMSDFAKNRYAYVPGSPYAEPEREASQ